MVKLVKEEKNSSKIKEWSKKFVNDLLNDSEIKELAKLPNNKQGDQAVYIDTGKNYYGNTVIVYDSYGSGGEFHIDGFDENGKPYFDDGNGGTVSYDQMLSEIKNEIKDLVNSQQEYDKEQEVKLAKAKKKFSKLSQEEKDKIVMNYLMSH